MAKWVINPSSVIAGDWANIPMWTGHIMYDINIVSIDYDELEKTRFPDGVTNGLISLAIEIAVAIEAKRAAIRSSITRIDYYPVDACEAAAQKIIADDYETKQELIDYAVNAGYLTSPTG